MDLSNEHLLIFAALFWHRFPFKCILKVQEFIDNVGRTVIKYFAHNDEADDDDGDDDDDDDDDDNNNNNNNSCPSSRVFL